MASAAVQPHSALRLTAGALFVGLACFLSTEAVANNLQPLLVSPIWPTNAILFCALIVTPVRHWWAFALAGFFSAVNNNANNGATALQIVVFLIADVLEVVIAALGVRRFAGGAAAFETPRNLACYLMVVVAAPIVPSLVASQTAPSEAMWTFWRSWFLTNSVGYLTLAPAILACRSILSRAHWSTSRSRTIEAVLLGAGLLLTTARVFFWPAGFEPHAPALMYLPLPFLLWAAMRFGASGATVSLAIATLLAMAGVLHGQGPFSASTPADAALSLQLFLVTAAPPFMFMAVLVEGQRGSREALSRSESQYRAIVEDQTELICRFRPDGTYTFVNGAVCRDLGCAAEDLVGNSFWIDLPAECHGALREFANSITSQRPVASRELDMAGPGQVARWQHWTVRGFFDHRGVVTEYQAVGQDITERKLAEDERRQLESQRQTERVLRASEERFRRLADSAPVLIWMSGLHNEGLYFNKPWLDFTGRSLEEELGFGWVASIHPNDREACVRVCNQAFERREPLTMQFRLRRHDGEYRWILDNGTPFYGADGAFSGYVGSCVDITARKLAEEELEEAARSKDEFLAILGHELRNPLAPIGMAIEIMRRVPPTEDSVGWAREVIARQLTSLTRLVDDLMDVSRITRGKIPLLVGPLELTRVVAEAVETSRPLIDGRGHDLTVSVPSDPVWVRGDGVRLGQVVSNLLNNAARYTTAGEGRISLTVGHADSMVTLAVADNGFGLPPEMLERVFDPFLQLQSPDQTHGGLGIGLTLVKRLVELHGGEVEARSAGRGRGSEFIVRLPALEGMELEGVDASVRTAQPLTRHRILVVDDNVDAAEALCWILRLQDQEVSVAYDGNAALQIAGAMQPDIVFLDLKLPGMNGLDVARQIRTQSPTGGPVLVATTGYGQDEDRRRTTDAGFDHHLVKPIDPQVLRSLLAGVDGLGDRSLGISMQSHPG